MGARTAIPTNQTIFWDSITVGFYLKKLYNLNTLP